MQAIGVPFADAGQTREGEIDLREALVAGEPERDGAAHRFDDAAPDEAREGSGKERKDPRLVEVEAETPARILFERGQNCAAPEHEAHLREGH